MKDDLHRLVRFWFFETFAERSIERTQPVHGDWDEVCGWMFRGKFHLKDKSNASGQTPGAERTNNV